jgi:hypothetical protein
MGLDGVEIIMEVEEVFGISISDEDAAELFTPGDLVDYISSQVPTRTAEECLTQQLFHRLRRGFRAQVPALLQRFDLDMPIRDVLHRDQWSRVWAAVRATAGDSSWPAEVPWPGLLRDGPKTVRHLIWHIVGSLPRPNVSAGELWTRVRIEAEVRRVVTGVSGVKDYRLNAEFVKDLGIN